MNKQRWRNSESFLHNANNLTSAKLFARIIVFLIFRKKMYEHDKFYCFWNYKFGETKWMIFNFMFTENLVMILFFEALHGTNNHLILRIYKKTFSVFTFLISMNVRMKTHKNELQIFLRHAIWCLRFILITFNLNKDIVCLCTMNYGKKHFQR